MAPSVPSSEPITFVAGDTVRWTKSLGEYSPDDGYVLSYAFRGEKGDGRLDLTAVNDNGTHSITITPTQSNLMRPGIWVWAAYATLGLDRYKVGSGTTRVEPNLAVTNFATDLRTPAKRAYDNALDAWETFAKAKSVTLNGRTYTAQDASELIKYVDRCKSDYALEQQYKDIETGGDPRKVYVRLNPYD